MTQDELDAIFHKFESLPNVTVSQHSREPLVNDILKSDIVIADGTSALAEVVVADKPIIYLSNGINKEFESNELSRQFINYVYLAYEPNEIIQHLDYIRTHDFACKQNYNAHNFKQQLDPVENPAEFISQYVF